MYCDKGTTRFTACGVGVYSTRWSLSWVLNLPPDPTPSTIVHGTCSTLTHLLQPIWKAFPVLEIFCWRKYGKPAVVHYWNQNKLWHFRLHMYNDSIVVVHPPGLILAACSSEDWGLAVILRTSWWWRVRGAWQHGNRTASDGWMMMMIRTATLTPSSVDLPLWTLSCES